MVEAKRPKILGLSRRETTSQGMVLHEINLIFDRNLTDDETHALYEHIRLIFDGQKPWRSPPAS